MWFCFSSLVITRTVVLNKILHYIFKAKFRDFPCFHLTTPNNTGFSLSNKISPMNSNVSDSLPVSTSTNHLWFFFCFFFPAVILPILMFMQKETTFKRELKYFQQFLVSICVIFYLIFFSFL